VESGFFSNENRKLCTGGKRRYYSGITLKGFTVWYNSKRLLVIDKIRLVRWEKKDEYFSDLTVATAGEDLVLTYANMALKTQVEKLLISHLSNEQVLE